MQWQDKLASKLLKCPYVHITFTLPSEFRSLARRNPTEIYNCLFRSAWSSLKETTAETKNLGATPGAVMVLHTFGSDLKYHIHIHCMVTFGGLNDQGEWKWPIQKKKIVGYRQIRAAFRRHFLERLLSIYPNLLTTQSYEDLKTEVTKKSWCVHAEPPTCNTDRLKEYLGKYICRIGLSKQRFHYDEVNQKVTLSCKDYKKQKSPEVPPPMTTVNISPLVAIAKIMQHCLPRYFQKSRYVGLHSNSRSKSIKEQLPQTIKNNGQTVRTVMQIMRAMLGLEATQCSVCQNDQFTLSGIPRDTDWLHTWLQIPDHTRGSPKKGSTYQLSSHSSQLSESEALCPKQVKSLRNTP